MEDLRVDYDHSVRNNGCIIQFIYGDDGMDSCAVESQSYMIMEMDTDKLCDMFLYDKNFLERYLMNRICIEKV